jgi:hypothetical protein
MIRYHLYIAVLLVLAACQLESTSAAAPIRAKWIKESSQAHPYGEMPTHSENPLLKWWNGLTGHHTKKTDSKPECMWLDYPRHDALKAWEIQASPRRHVIRDRDKAIHNMEHLLRKLSNDPKTGVQFVEDSRYMAVFRETSFQVSTRHGHPLYPKTKEEKHSTPFPWKGLAYLRLRQYKVLTPGGAHVPSAMPGMADLTLKMKKIDPDLGPAPLELPDLVGSSKLTAKLEYDGHCDHGRISMSPLYRPVNQSLNVSRIGNVKGWYPNLAEVSRIGEDQPLLFMHDVHRAKVVWTVLFNGVVGEANLVIKYNTTFQDAVAGHKPKNGEVSLRIRRDVAEATGTTGEDEKRTLYAALDSVAGAMQAFRDHGWDDKTPALPDDGDDDDDGGHGDGDSNCCCKQCGCKQCGDISAAGDGDSNKCGCHCKCCECKHCGGSSAAGDADSSKCGCGCKCGCDCKHCDCKHCGDSEAVAAAAADSNKCGCGCKCGCDCKHCGDSKAVAAAAEGSNKCSCGCKCGCDCKYCGDSKAVAAAAEDRNKCSCGCKCGCDCKHCDCKHCGDSKAVAAAAEDGNKCSCGCKCGCDCKHCGDVTTAAAEDCNKCGCGCKCGYDCQHCSDSKAMQGVSVKLFDMLPRPLMWGGVRASRIRFGQPKPLIA